MEDFYAVLFSGKREEGGEPTFEALSEPCSFRERLEVTSPTAMMPGQISSRQ